MTAGLISGLALVSGAMGVGSAGPMDAGAGPSAELTDLSAVAPTDLQVDPVGQGAGVWDLAFAEEFAGGQLDPAIWTTCYWWDRGGCTNQSTNERQWYLPDQVSVDDGSLVLEADHGPVSGLAGEEFPYLSGMVTTGRRSPDRSVSPGFSFQYGYVEMRARVPSGPGLWPAFWLLPVTHDAKPEIDVMEILGSAPERVLFHVHWRDFQGDLGEAGGSWSGPDFSADWHVFAIRWAADELVWYVDGVERHRFGVRGAIPHEPMYIIANLAVGGEYAGDPSDPRVFPARFAIDYIRVWQLPEP